MSEGLFSPVELGNAGRPGFRLARLEVYNWGTFDHQVWRLEAGGETMLVTGDIGSGKSTLVDAVSTLLLPSHRIDYNKAAGAGKKERTLRSYVEGYHKTERNEATGTVRPVALRDRNSYSVILGVFANEGYDEQVTLAQVFQQQDGAGQPWRRFVTADRALSIAEDFTDFGSDLNTLLARLREGGATVEKDFPSYGRIMRRALGIRSEQAMELFHQTISMKSVGDLNEFVRTHMLEPANAKGRIDGIISHFEDLTTAYDAVQRAREQLEVLEPLVASAEKYDVALERRDRLREEQVALRPYFAELRLDLRRSAIEQTRAELETLTAQLTQTREESGALSAERDRLLTARAEAGGNRIGELEQEAAQAREEAEERRARRSRFDAAVSDAGLEVVSGAEEFAALAAHVEQRRTRLEADSAELSARYQELVLEHGEQKKQLREVSEELDSLAGRRSNLPAEQLELRGRLCRELGFEQAELPFAGELLDMREEHAEWRGAAERVLRGFALSLLVPQQHYADVAEWVNGRRLTARRSDGREVGVRLVYERVPDRQVTLQRPQVEGLLLADTVDIADTPLRGYLHRELYARADHHCADTMEEFRAAERAVTREGQVRSRDRHVKDDSRSASDPRGWVLGWRNEQKVAALQERCDMLIATVAELAAGLESTESARKDATRSQTALARLADQPSWKDLDWQQARDRAEAADAERLRLIEGSTELAEINQRLASADVRTAELAETTSELADQLSRGRGSIEHETAAMSRDKRVVEQFDEANLAAAREVYPRVRERHQAAEWGADGPSGAATAPAAATAETAADADATHSHEQALSDELSSAIDKTNIELGEQSSSMQRAMSEIRRRWPAETMEMDVSVAARAEYVRFHARVANDDLPRFVDEFEHQLRTNTIRELAGLHNWLLRKADEIQQKIEKINEALGAIDFNPGRFIRLDRQNTVNQHVREFRAELRAVTDDALSGGGDQYSEQRYRAVQGILERLRGREGYSDADRKWREHVTDVRNWYTFSASERDRETDEEWEHYRDSDGKSGGQKEKLAYTILAASLAYQFGLEWGAKKARDFRFAVIDEAFGRGSDISSRYALELFAKLGIQLLIVTPMQKVHVIAPYVRSIGYVDNVEGKYSRLVVLDTEEYHEMRGRS